MYLQYFLNSIRNIFKKSTVKRSEIVLIVAASLVGFFATLNYNIFKVLKDTLALSIPNKEGALFITSLKIWVVLPVSMLFVFTINSLNRFFPLKKIFIMIALFYTALLIVFGMYYSYFPSLYLQDLVLPKGATTLFYKSLIPLYCIVKYWPITFFYVFAETWHTTIYLFVFWSILNASFSHSMTKRIYPLLNLVGNLAGAFIFPTFSLSKYLSKGNWESQVYILTIFNIIIIVSMLGCFLTVSHILDHNIYKKNDTNTKASEKKAHLSILSGLKKTYNNYYIGALFLTTICYGIVLNLTEVLWKEMLIQAFEGDKVLIAAQLSSTIAHSAILSVIFGLLLPVTFNAIGVALTLVIYQLSSLLFISGFIISQYKYSINGEGFFIISTCILAGKIGIVVLRSGKYAIYDTVKDMCLNILDYRTMVETKGLIDTIFSRIGKSIASSQYNLTSSIISRSFAIYASRITVGITSVIWIFCGAFLGKTYEKKIKNK